MRIAWHSRQYAHEHLCRAFFMQRHLPQLPRHTSRPTKTNGVSREYERGMMHTSEFCQQSSIWAHAGSRHVVATGSLYQQKHTLEDSSCASIPQMLDMSTYGGKICCDHQCRVDVAP